MADGASIQEENIVPISNKVRSNTLKRKIAPLLISEFLTISSIVVMST